MKTSSAKTVDEFIAESPVEDRAILEQLRVVIKSAVPDIEETMGYGKPYYKYHGWMTGITLYTKYLGVEIWDELSDSDCEDLEKLGYKTGSKNFQIKYDQQIPVVILTRLVRQQGQRNHAKEM